MRIHNKSTMKRGTLDVFCFGEGILLKHIYEICTQIFQGLKQNPAANKYFVNDKYTILLVEVSSRMGLFNDSGWKS